ncbi:hypothetical protein JOB18_038734 [Solea senegalensis]|uniref:Uncharacterized protein n=1 Tax=Solea senegalensis TaxID=28829 RepID=A0AAV6S5U8_SOLSE|nr:hypothetical protein JOB18_038734 [Solea senegalensis]
MRGQHVASQSDSGEAKVSSAASSSQSISAAAGSSTEQSTCMEQSSSLPAAPPPSEKQHKSSHRRVTERKYSSWLYRIDIVCLQRLMFLSSTCFSQTKEAAQAALLLSLLLCWNYLSLLRVNTDSRVELKHREKPKLHFTSLPPRSC